MDTSLIDVWTIDLCVDRPLILSSEEAARAARFRNDLLRARWCRTHTALREILARYLHCELLEIQFTCNAQGKPYTQGLQFNLSHCDDWAMIAVSRHVEVGIDIERFRPKVEMGRLLERLGEQNIPEDPYAQHQRWTVREAASKAQGGALFDPVRPAVQVSPIDAPPGYFASLAALEVTPVPNYCGGGSL